MSLELRRRSGRCHDDIVYLSVKISASISLEGRWRHVREACGKSRRPIQAHIAGDALIAIFISSKSADDAIILVTSEVSASKLLIYFGFASCSIMRH